MSKEISSEVCFNVLEGHSSVIAGCCDNIHDNTDGERAIISLGAQEESGEIAYESLIERLVEE